MKKLLIFFIVIILLFFLIFFFQETQGAIMKIIYPVIMDRGLVGYWTMNGPDINWATNQATDASGNGNTGQLIAISTSTSPVAGMVGQALYFNGANYADTGSWSNDLNVITVCSWVRPVNGARGDIAAKWTPTGNNRQFDLLQGTTANKFQFFISTTGANAPASAVSATSIVKDTWYHVCGSYDGANIKLFVNGLQEGANVAQTGDLYGGSTANNLIGKNSADFYYTGSIDEVRIYNRALSAAEIYYLYQKSAPATANKISSDQNSLLTNGLTAYWSFNGPDMDWNNGILDASGNGNKGPINNFSTTTSPTLGVVGQGLFFDGTTDSFTVSNASNQIIPASDAAFSISLWAKSATSSCATTNNVVNLITNTSGSTGFRFGIRTPGYGSTGRTLSFWSSENGGSINLAPTAKFPLNIWQHIVVSYTGSSAEMYANGEIVATDSSGTVVSNTATVGIGNNQNSYCRWWGAMDEVRIYNRALSGAEALYLYQKTSPITANKISSDQNSEQTGGLVGLWSFNGQDMDWASGLAYDRSVSGNNGTLKNMSTTTSPAIGVVGQAMKFNGSDNVITIANNSFLDNLSAFTFTAWVNSAAAQIQKAVASSQSGPSAGQAGVLIETDNSTGSGVLLGINDGTNPFGKTTSGLKHGVWQQWVVAFDGSQSGNSSRLKFYLDGVEQTLSFTGTIPATTGNTTKNFTIGASLDSSATRYFNGSIDEVRIYNRALSAAEIIQLYQTSKH